MQDIIVIAILAVVIGLAAGYIWRAKKRGGCVGCSHSGSCGGCCGTQQKKDR